jgi:AraC family transcriptional regulator, regulatory protein of adaptative response / methylated-DNA-[protein]-cysteine methyltransferase
LIGDDTIGLRAELQNRFPNAQLCSTDALDEPIIAKVVRFVGMPEETFRLPLDLRGTAFQQQVWQALREIPAGSTASYADIAKKIGKPRAVRAVAGACAANPLAVVIPCHRVVRTDGGLSGYRWGISRKRALLDREAGVRDL